MNILITSAKGFVGKNLVCNLHNIMEGKNRTRPDIAIDAILKLMNGKIRLFELDTETGKKYNEITQRRSALLKDLGIL